MRRGKDEVTRICQFGEGERRKEGAAARITWIGGDGGGGTWRYEEEIREKDKA
jgi:hypothetical protein